MFTTINDQKYAIPISLFGVKCVVNDSFVLIELIQTYKNNTNHSLETEFSFPAEVDSVISKMIIQIEDKTIETKLMAKAKAQEKYEDAIASGHSAAILK